MKTSAKRIRYRSIVPALLMVMPFLHACQQERPAETEKPAYMISSGHVVAPEKMPAYLEASKPLFKAAGSEELAFGKTTSDGSIQLLEGEWPDEPLVMIIKFPSMDGLMEFWNSPEYQEAIKLREGVVEPNFTVAIEPR